MIHAFHRLLIAAISLLLASLLSSCGGDDSHEAIMADAFDLMEQVAAVLEKVNDEESAEQAAAELVAIADKMEEIAERNDAIGPPSPETVEKLQEQFKKRRADLESRLNVAKLKEVAGEQDGPLREAFARLGAVVEKMR